MAAVSFGHWRKKRRAPNKSNNLLRTIKNTLEKHGLKYHMIIKVLKEMQIPFTVRLRERKTNVSENTKILSRRF